MNQMAKLNHLLTELMLGDCAPSQLLREMNQLGGDKVDIETTRLQESENGLAACCHIPGSGCQSSRQA